MVSMPNIDINSPVLESFMLEVPSYYDSCWSSIKISASCLRKFIYVGGISEEFVLSNPSSVLHASINISFVKERTSNDHLPEVGIRASKLLKQLQGAEYMELKGYAVKVLSHAKDYVINLPMFGKLIYLELMNKITSFEIMLDLLHKSPILNSLVLRGEPSFAKELLVYILALTSVPLCLTSFGNKRLGGEV
ncbi:F-box/FBD/LRR-repeat protein [Quillaja saponaria]|uniref:F-box/FBD/LRR-repeat protein n=1 Tax=Quillaja saponaria TaxID=32244 RepID=A0AAD7L321_QUISA|nr:F-box/FBD/LRR-repeat protein [Quillaja saponaria]